MNANTFKLVARKVPFARRLHQALWLYQHGADGNKGTTKLNAIRDFPLFAPTGGGTYQDKAKLTIGAINKVVPALLSLVAQIGIIKIDVLDIEKFPTTPQEMDSCAEIKKYFDKYGSDKANGHNYHLFYGTILADRDRPTGVLEIGLGTRADSSEVVSSMGPDGTPGASVRAFRDFLPNATVYGADIDTDTLFTETRIKTFFVDQTNRRSLAELGSSVPSNLDLVIDDGIHTVDANIDALAFGLSKIKVGGCVVIEDIGQAAAPLWQVIGALLPEKYVATLLSARGGMLFVARRMQ